MAVMMMMMMMMNGAAHAVQVYRERKNHTQPPVSLLGQLLWREVAHACTGAWCVLSSLQHCHDRR